MKRADKTWTIDRLATYCTSGVGREASEAWCLGEAFEIAKGKVGHGKWDAWRRKHKFSASLTERYMKLHKAATLEQVAGMSLTQACHTLGVHINGAKKKTIPTIAEPTWSAEKRAVSADDVASSGGLAHIVDRMTSQLQDQQHNQPDEVHAAINNVLDALDNLQTILADQSGREFAKICEELDKAGLFARAG